MYSVLIQTQIKVHKSFYIVLSLPFQLDRSLTFDGVGTNWVELENNTAPSTNSRCRLNPLNSVGHGSEYPYSIMPNVTLADMWFCNENFSSKPDLCLMYPTRNTLLCNVSSLLSISSCLSNFVVFRKNKQTIILHVCTCVCVCCIDFSNNFTLLTRTWYIFGMQ